MLTPKDVLGYFGIRAQRGQSEILQLIDGILPGGQIVVGGAESNVRTIVPLMTGRQRIGRVVSTQNAVLDPEITTTFDTAAIVQLLMQQKNGSFHEACEMCIGFIQKALGDGHSIDAALQLLQHQVDKVQKL